MKREVPLIIVFVTGAFMALQYFVPHYLSAAVYANANNWTIIIGIFTLVVGIGSLISMHYDKIARRKEHWPYSIVTMVALALMTIIGLSSPNAIQNPRGLFMHLYFFVLAPITATMFALLAFFIASLMSPITPFIVFSSLKVGIITDTDGRVAVISRHL